MLLDFITVLFKTIINNEGRRTEFCGTQGVPENFGHIQFRICNYLKRQLALCLQDIIDHLEFTEGSNYVRNNW